MPCWAIHLKLAKELQREFKLDKDKFYFGSILPDADRDWAKNRRDLHYYDGRVFPKSPNDDMINFDAFLVDYGDKLEDDLILGYYCHLFADNFYNEYVYSKYWIKDPNKNVVGIKLLNGVSNDGMNRQKYKHHDFQLYGIMIYYNHELEFPKNVDTIMQSVILLKDNFWNKEIVSNRINNICAKIEEFNKLKNDDYFMISKNKLDELYTFCLNALRSEIKKIKKV